MNFGMGGGAGTDPPWISRGNCIANRGTASAKAAKKTGLEPSVFSVQPKLGTEGTIPRKDVSKVGRDGSCRVWKALC